MIERLKIFTFKEKIVLERLNIIELSKRNNWILMSNQTRSLNYINGRTTEQTPNR